MSMLSLFEGPRDDAPRPSAPRPMYDSQRAQIRDLLSRLDLTTAKDQFALVEGILGVRLAAVTDLNADDAQRLIPRLRSRVQTSARAMTGDSWTDRDDTWIDKL